MCAVEVASLPPKAELWCRVLLQRATISVNQIKPPGLHITENRVRKDFRRVKSEDWDIGSGSFWQEMEEHPCRNALCESDLSDDESVPKAEKNITREEFMENVFRQKERQNSFWKSKRKEKKYWKARRERRANLLANRTMQTVKLENTLEPMPLWRQREMTIRVFMVVAVVVKMRRPAWVYEDRKPQLRKLPQIHTIMCPQDAFEVQVVRKAYLGPSAPPWSPNEDEDIDHVDLSRWPSMFCSSCQDYVLLPFGVKRQCPKCKRFLS